ncbi:SigE family RNA polymerase sigma factor [Blastococcus jejuensis]|uniref:SigE family RNA polymerase sigma factor n=1 Tax=Blastococcus jejuensis TaxID=351224 RepID=A0ABP6PEX2_9ACTN
MARRDDEAFSEFVRAHGPSLLRTARLLTGDRSRGEDLTQSALARAYAQWAKVERADVPVAYVRKLLVNTHLSWRRLLSNTERVIETVPDRSDGADLQAAHAAVDEMRTALLHLSPRVRTAVVLRYFDDLSEAETARLMGCSVSTVNKHVGSGLRALRTLLAPQPDPAQASRRLS